MKKLNLILLLLLPIVLTSCFTIPNKSILVENIATMENYQKVLHGKKLTPTLKAAYEMQVRRSIAASKQCLKDKHGIITQEVNDDINEQRNFTIGSTPSNSTISPSITPPNINIHPSNIYFNETQSGNILIQIRDMVNAKNEYITKYNSFIEKLTELVPTQEKE